MLRVKPSPLYDLPSVLHISKPLGVVKFQKTEIEKIKLKYGENFTPREIEYNVEYEENGDLKTININGKIYNYIFKRLIAAPNH